MHAWLIDWMVFYTAFNSISVISRQQLTLFMSFLGYTRTRLGLEVSCPRTLLRENPEDPVRLEPRTPVLRVKTLYHGATQDLMHAWNLNNIHSEWRKNHTIGQTDGRADKQTANTIALMQTAVGIAQTILQNGNSNYCISTSLLSLFFLSFSCTIYMSQ